MPIFKCKMCGGQLNIADDCKIVECEYCGSTQTLPSFDNEKKSNLFNRANNLRLNKEFDKAAGVYESIVAEFPDEAEAYWGLCLCKFGIEYVDDPTTGKKVPTCHRTCTTSIMNDNDFELTCENADIVSKKVYREEAKAIDCIQKRILEVVAKEEPYDVFICYKETDDVTHTRTEDSSIAQDIYTELVKEGYRVFFSRVSLREKAGTEYEPYIYAALSSAKVMLAIGTKFEYYDAVWVKNEWSRFIGMLNETNGKTLIPCYRDIDAYDMPKEFRNIQALDIHNVTFSIDLFNIIRTIIPQKKQTSTSELGYSPNTPSVESLIKRMYGFLEDCDWKRANEYAERILDINAECAEAYLGLALSEEKLQSVEALILGDKIGNKNYLRARKCADLNLLNTLDKHEKRRAIQYLAQAIKMVVEKKGREKALHFQSMISASSGQIIGLRTTGNVISTDYVCKNESDALYYFGECSVYDWNNIIKVAAGHRFALGLKVDGTVASAGDNVHNQCKVDDWTDIIDISAGTNHAVGLKSNGTVIATEHDCKNVYTSYVGMRHEMYNGQCDVSEWKDIVAISAGDKHTVGLKSDGTVLATEYFQWKGLDCSHTLDYYGQCDVSEWKNVVAVAAGSKHTVGLKADGTVIATKYLGGYYNGQCDVSEWKDIVAIAAGASHTVGLKSDGKVVATKYTGNYYNGQCDVYEWKDIVAIAAGWNLTVGLQSDGTVLVTSSLNDISCHKRSGTLSWNLLDSSTDSKMNELQQLLKNKELQLVVQREHEEEKRKIILEKEEERKRLEFEERTKKITEEKLRKMRMEEDKRAEAKRIEEEKERQRIIEKRRRQGLCLDCGGTFKGIFSKKCSQCGKHKDY